MEPISGVCHSDSIYLMYKNFNLVKYTYEYNDAGEEQWIIEPNWKEYELSGLDELPGITVEKKYRYKKHYRDSMPYAIACVCPSKERALKANRAVLRRYGMWYWDPIEFLRRTRGINTAYGPYYFSKSPTDYLDISKVTYQWLLSTYMDYSGREYNKKHGYDNNGQ